MEGWSELLPMADNCSPGIRRFGYDSYLQRLTVGKANSGKEFCYSGRRDGAGSHSKMGCNQYNLQIVSRI